MRTLRQACCQEIPGSAMCVQNFNDSRGLAIRITYRISLRSSSLWEPRHPLLKVVIYWCFMTQSQWGTTAPIHDSDIKIDTARRPWHSPKAMGSLPEGNGVVLFWIYCPKANGPLLSASCLRFSTHLPTCQWKNKATTGLRSVVAPLKATARTVF